MRVRHGIDIKRYDPTTYVRGEVIIDSDQAQRIRDMYRACDEAVYRLVAGGNDLPTPTQTPLVATFTDRAGQRAREAKQ